MSFVLAFPVILQTLNGPHPFQGLHGTPALPQPVSLGVVFVLVTGVMAGLGQGTARLFVRFRPLRAYRLDILGSLAGIAAFTGLSFLNQPPGTWGCHRLCRAAGPAGSPDPVVAGPGRGRRRDPAAAGVGPAGAGVVALQQAVVQPDARRDRGAVCVREQHPLPGGPLPGRCMHKQKAFYFYPYRHVTKASLGNVLIIGSGTGNDAAVALSEGARHVDTVEIDPLLVRLGNMHPNHPYSNPRLTAHVDDGRAYLQDTSKHYNLILFALPDSLTALAGQSAIRLESYLLTVQSLASGARPPGAGRHVRDVQLLRAVPGEPVRVHDRGRVRADALRRGRAAARRAPAGRAHGASGRAGAELRQLLPRHQDRPGDR